MLVNLDNEVHFKKVFTDVEVFTAFVKDILGISIHIDKVETEKVLPSKISAIKFRMDLFAEDEESRTVVEIQKIDYDYSYDRFAHYFMGNLIDMQRSSKDYSFEKNVYIIVVVTSAYRISEKNGKPIKDDVLVTDINPRTLKGEVRDMHNHKLVILNTTYVSADTPEKIKDWADLIIQSMKNPENPKINKNNTAIAKAMQLANLDDLSPEQLADAKIHEMRKATLALMQSEGKREERDNGIRKALKRGKLTHAEIAEDFEVSLEVVAQLAAEMQSE